MQIALIGIGKTSKQHLLEGIAYYEKRVAKYLKFQLIELPNAKGNLSKKKLLQKEEEIFLKALKSEDSVYLLDDKRKAYTSMEFANLLQISLNHSRGRICFLVGGAYGFSEQLKAKFPKGISLSKMTFSHQIIRLLFMEQLYRGLAILNNDPYHNE